MEIDDMRNRPWMMWVIGILVSIAVILSGYSFSRMDAILAALPDKYVSRVEFQNFADRLEKKTDRIEMKLDRLVEQGCVH